MSERVPEAPGWWWHRGPGDYIEPIKVAWSPVYPGELVAFPGGRAQGIRVDSPAWGGWIAPVVPPEEAGAIVAERDALRAHRDRLAAFVLAVADVARDESDAADALASEATGRLARFQPWSDVVQAIRALASGEVPRD